MWIKNKWFYIFPLRLLLLILIIQTTCSYASAQNTEHQDNYRLFLSEYGSEKPAHTIYTNPGEDCSSSMNISWASPPGTKCMIELTDVATGLKYLYEDPDPDPDELCYVDSIVNGVVYEFPFTYRCETFNDIPSVLSDRTKVNEMHIFDKHGYELFDLEPDKDYSYRIITINNITGEKEYSDTYRFRTAGAKAWKAAILGDFHHYSPLWKRLDSAMEMLEVIKNKSGGFDWVLSLGDVCAYGGSFNFWTELSEQPNYKNFMWATAQGNHDTMSSNKIVSDNFFRDSHFFPFNGYEGQEGVSYWFKYGDVLFLVLNNEAMHDDSGLAVALEWMENAIKDNPAAYVVVMTHYQWISGTNGATAQLERFYETFDRLGVDLAISGNHHIYVRTPALKEMEVTSPGEGTYYVVIPSSDNDRGRALRKLTENEDIIAQRWSEGPHTVGGMIMDVNPKRMEMILYDRFGEEQDRFTVPGKRH